MKTHCKVAPLRVTMALPGSVFPYGVKVFMDAHEPVTLEEGDRYPLAPPVSPP